MKAYVTDAYGSPDVLKLVDRAMPQPKDDEVLVRIRATTVTSGDARIRAFNMPKGFRFIGRLVLGWNRPRQGVLGAEMAGEIVAVGRNVTRFRTGDRVFGLPVTGCHAEYRAIRAEGPLALIPEGMSFEEAAALPFGGVTALSFLTRGGLQAGQSLLINGASGAVGVASLQVAVAMGIEVTAVCSSGNHELMRSLGAAQVIDYRRGDIFAAGTRYDAIMDTVGNLSLHRVAPYLRPRGRLLAVVGVPGPADVPAMLSGKRVVGGMAVGSAGLMEQIADLAKRGALKPVVARRFAFAELPAAHAYVDSGHKIGAALVVGPE